MREHSSMSIAGGLNPFAALERSPLFAGLDRADVMSASMLMRPRSFEAGQVLFRAGEEGDAMHVVVDGLVHVVGAESRRSRRGDIVGAGSLLTGEPRASTAVASMPTETLELPADAFATLAERHPAVLRNLAAIFARRAARTDVRAGDAGARGEAVGLIVGRSAAGALDAVLAAAEAASARPIARLDTREGFDEAMARLDDLLGEHGTVVVISRAEGRTAPLLGDHVDRAVVLAYDPAEAERFPDLPVVGGGNPAQVGRLLTRTRLGLALGAGGAKGFAHVGVLQVLEEAGYTVDCVAGASIGAIVGTYMALGLDAAAIEAQLREDFKPDNVAEMFKLSLAGGSTGLDLITRLFQETTQRKTFEDVRMPLAVMTVDLTDRCPAPIREGPLWEALLAATALAGMFPPHERDGHRLVDGLALVPVPTGAAREDGADIVLSVNLMSDDVLEAWPGEEPPPPPPPKRGSRMLDTILEVMDLMQLETSVRHAGLAEVVVTPRFGPGSWRDFHLAEQFLDAGREAARAALPALADLARPS